MYWLTLIFNESKRSFSKVFSYATTFVCFRCVIIYEIEMKQNLSSIKLIMIEIFKQKMSAFGMLEQSLKTNMGNFLGITASHVR